MERARQEMADYLADGTVLTNRDLLEYWKGKLPAGRTCPC